MVAHEAPSTLSLWQDTYPGRHFPALSGDLEVDIAVVGGGITGILTALELKRAGKTVALIEANQIAAENTGLTTAHLTAVLDTRWHKLIDKFGVDGAKLAYECHRGAIARIEQLAMEKSIDCDFRRVAGYLFTEESAATEDLEKEIEACAKIGFACSRTAHVPLPFATRGGLMFPDQARFHPRAFLFPLLDELAGDGCFVFEKTRGREIEDGDPCRVVTESGTITAREVIVAAHVPISNRLFLHTKLAAYRSYVLGVQLRAPVTDALFWDTEDPYHYIRTAHTEHGDLLIVGGEDHKVGQEDDAREAFADLAAWTRERLGSVDISYKWSGQIIETVDGLPYIGKNSMSDHVWVATGYSGNGMTNGMIAAEVLSALVQGEEHPAADLFDATRLKPIASVKRFVSENVDFPAHLVGDRLKKPDANTFMDVPHGEGKILEHDGRKLAVHRADNGELTVLSATCTHLGCIVHWNTVEKSWDCPCHGSRFDAQGEVLDGPAIEALQPVIDISELTPTTPENERTAPALRRLKLIAE